MCNHLHVAFLQPCGFVIAQWRNNLTAYCLLKNGGWEKPLWELDQSQMYSTASPTSKVPVKVNLDSGLWGGILTSSVFFFSVNVLWEWFSLLMQFSLYLAFVIMSLSCMCMTDAPPIKAATLCSTFLEGQMWEKFTFWYVGRVHGKPRKCEQIGQIFTARFAGASKIQNDRYWGEEKEIMLMLAKQQEMTLGKRSSPRLYLIESLLTPQNTGHQHLWIKTFEASWIWNLQQSYCIVLCFCYSVHSLHLILLLWLISLICCYI